ncbi:inner centromere protein [Choanephora cucurbitarum]|nr:inner centromere protein [Choanephora cucurbitarum]
MPTAKRPAALQNSFMSRLFRMGKQKMNTIEKQDTILELEEPQQKRPRLMLENNTLQPSISDKKSTADKKKVKKKRKADEEERIEEKVKIQIEEERAKAKVEAKIQAEAKLKTEAKADEEEEEEHQVPSWAEDPELERHLKHQSGLDPDKIFGKMPPLHLQTIFPRIRQQFVPVIPEELS